MMAEFALCDRQAEAILNMRLRSLRKLEEMEIAKERAALAKERDDLEKLIESPPQQRTRLKRDLAALKEKFGDDRRTRIEAARGDARDRLVGDDREGADHGHPIAARLDPGDEGPSRARPGRRPEMARGRRTLHPFPRPDDRPAGAVRVERARLHARRRQAAERARLRRAGSPVHRPRCRSRHRSAARRPPRDEAVGRLLRREGLRHRAAKRRLAETRKGKQLVNVRAGARVAVVRADPAKGPTRSRSSARIARCSSSRWPNFPSSAEGRA